MEDHFQCDLTERKKEIGQLIDRIINESRSDSSSDDEQIIRDLKAQSKKASQHNGSSKQAIKKKDISDKKSDSSEDEVDDEEIARRLQEEEGKRPTRSRGVKKTVPKKKKMTDAPKKKRSTSNNAYMRPLALSPVLAAFTGELAVKTIDNIDTAWKPYDSFLFLNVSILSNWQMPRHEVVKKVWSYVKEHNLFVSVLYFPVSQPTSTFAANHHSQWFSFS